MLEALEAVDLVCLFFPVPLLALSPPLTIILHFITSLGHNYQVKCHGDNKTAGYLVRSHEFKAWSRS